jgi:hypothetical protein
MSQVGATWIDELESAAERLRGQLGVSTLSISRYRTDVCALHTLVNVGVLGRNEERRPAAEVYPLGDFQAAAALVRHRRPYLSAPGVPGDPASLAIEAALGKSSQAAAPLIVDDVVWGELWTASAGSDLMLERSELPLVCWAAERFGAVLAELAGDLEHEEPPLTNGSRHRRRYEVWVEGTLDPQIALALTGVPGKPVDRFTVLTGELTPVELYELIDRLLEVALAVVGIARDNARVVPPRRRSERHDYEVRFAGRLSRDAVPQFDVAVEQFGAGTDVTGRLDSSAVNGLLAMARDRGLELISLRCSA